MVDREITGATKVVKGYRKVNAHYHTSIDNIVVTTVMVIIGINLTRYAAAQMAKSSAPTVQGVGKALGAIVSFP